MKSKDMATELTGASSLCYTIDGWACGIYMTNRKYIYAFCDSSTIFRAAYRVFLRPGAY